MLAADKAQRVFAKLNNEICAQSACLDPPVEPDLQRPWSKNVWLYGLRVPFSLVFLGWITLGQAISPRFSFVIYAYILLAAFLGLVVGAHYIDIATSVNKFAPYFSIPKRGMLGVGIASVLAGILVGVYLALRWSIPFFLLFVAVEGVEAIAYPREIAKFAHSYTAFGLTWGALPVLASYYAQAGTIRLIGLAVSAFVGISVVMMHHLAIMTRESPDWKNAVYLLNLYRYSVYAVGAISLLSRVFPL